MPYVSKEKEVPFDEAWTYIVDNSTDWEKKQIVDWFFSGGEWSKEYEKSN